MDILLIPGFMLDADLWSDMRSALSRYGRLIDVDMTQDTSIEAIARRAIMSMDEPAIVIGFSMGGYVARSIAYQAGDRVKRLALIATSSRGNEGKRIARDAVLPRFQMLGRGAVKASLHPDHCDEAMIARVQQMSVRLGDATWQRQVRFERDDDTHRLPAIACPTAVIAAGQDALRTVEESRVLHDGIVGSTMSVIDHTGHLIPLEQPEALIQALQATLAGD